MKKLIAALLLAVTIPVQAGIRTAPKAYKQSIRHIQNDIDREIESWMDIEHFGFVYTLNPDTPEDVANRIVNELVAKGYKVILDFPQDSDGRTYTQISISWDDTSVVKR